MDISIYYCLFMLTCFGAQRKDIVLQLSCPLSCQCYYASSDGIGGSEAESFICEDLSFLRITSFHTKLINTFVLKKGQFQKVDYSTNKKYQTISVVLEDFNNNLNLRQADTQYIFNLFHHKTLKYLTILNSSFESLDSPLSSFDWTSLGSLANLETIYIENSYIPTLGQSFASISLNKLHTLVIKSSLLEYIDREALTGKWKIRKLIITDNEIRNWNWLTSLSRPLNELWHLDLNSNHLTYIPSDLKSILPNLRVFYLAHNRLRYFSYMAMLPWFDIDEFQPSKIKPKKDENYQSKDLQNYIYYNQDMESILQRQEIKAEFLVDSLVNQIFYVCGPIAGSSSWQDFPTLCRNRQDSMYHYFPDNLRVNENYQLETLKENADYKPSHVLIEGFDMSKTSINPNLPDEIFYFDSTTNLAKYRQNRVLLMNQLNSINMIGAQNAIRLNLFSKIMLNYFLGKTIVTNEQIRLIIDLVVELLDEANEKRIYVMLIMWDYDQQLVQSIPRDPIYKDSSGIIFKESVIIPLLERISNRPALIGIEVINKFLSAENEVISNPNGVHFDRCDPPYLNSVNSIMPQMLFLGFNAQLLKENSADKLIGVSIDASCQDCLKLTMAQTCRQKVQDFNFIDGFDFITFVSNTNNANQEQYHYSKWNWKDFDWFQKADLNTPVQSVAMHRAVFFVLQGQIDDATFVETINATANGYFIADQVSPQMDIVRNT